MISKLEELAAIYPQNVKTANRWSASFADRLVFALTTDARTPYIDTLKLEALLIRFAGHLTELGERALSFNGWSQPRRAGLQAPKLFDTTPDLSGARLSLRGVARGVLAAQSPRAAYDTVVSYLSARSEFFPFRDRLLRLVRDLGRLVIGDVPSTQYNTAAAIAEQNEGIQRYFLHELRNDKQLLQDAIEFYFEVAKLDLRLLADGIIVESSVFERAHHDIWDLAMRIGGGDPMRAIRMIGLYGHDNVKQAFEVDFSHPADALIDALNQMAPHLRSNMWLPGALRGLDIPVTYRERLGEIFEREKALIPGIELNSPNYRAAYYHFIGGALVASQLIRTGHETVGSARLTPFIARTLAFLYRYATTEKYLGAPEGETPATNTWILYSNGYTKPGAKAKVPPEAELTEADIARAKLFLDRYFVLYEMTLYQHEAGARWFIEQWSSHRRRSR